MFAVRSFYIVSNVPTLEVLPDVQNILQCLAIRRASKINATKPKPKPNLRQVMWISHCGKPVSVCDGCDSDCWQMECGCITCVGECVHGGCNDLLYNPPPLSLSLVSQWLSTSTTSPNTRHFVPCGVHKRDGTKRPALL